MSYSVWFQLHYFSVGFIKYCGVNIMYNKLCYASLSVSADIECKTVVILTGLTVCKCIFGVVQEACCACLNK